MTGSLRHPWVAVAVMTGLLLMGSSLGSAHGDSEFGCSAEDVR